MIQVKVKPSLVIVVAILSLVLVISFVYRKRVFGATENFAQQKAVLTWYMADWCGHCKNMKPVWEEFAKKVDASKVELKVVKDGEAGAKEAIAAAGVDGFPTIHFQKAGETKPIVYNGARTVEGLMEFVQKNL